MSDVPYGAGPAVHEARKALHCLRLEVPPEVAADVTAKVEAAFRALYEEVVDARLVASMRRYYHEHPEKEQEINQAIKDAFKLPLIDGREPFILECNGRFCVITYDVHPPLFLNADGVWHRNTTGEDNIHRLGSREVAEAFVVECAEKDWK